MKMLQTEETFKNMEEVTTFDQEEIELAEEIIGRRKCENTKNQYRRKFEHFRQWIVIKYPDCVLSDGITANLSTLNKSHLQDFFGHICKKKKGGSYVTLFV